MPVALINNSMPSEGERILSKRGFFTVRLPSAQGIEGPCASHPDILLFKYKDTLISSTEYCEYAPHVFSDIREYSSVRKMIFTDEVPTGGYPENAIFNILVSGERAYLKTDTASVEAKKLLSSSGLEIVHTNQGYPACSVLSLSGYAVTQDMGMARLLTENGVKVTLIDKHGISLPPYEYGFIGGASAVYGNTVYFFGDPDTHPSHKLIKETVKEAGYEYVCLFDGVLTDLGGIIFI